MLCLDGAVTLAGASGARSVELRLARGESVFVPHGTGPVVARGDGRAVVAYVP